MSGTRQGQLPATHVLNSSLSRNVVSQHRINLVSGTIAHQKCASHPCTFNCNMDMRNQDSQHQRIAEERPFSGDFAGMTWNPRAFFARDGVKMTRRIHKVRKYAEKLDLFGLQETHSSPERAAALQGEFPNHVLFWSHCSVQRGGLAVGVSKAFLKNFCRATWTEVEQGRIGKLELEGPKGTLDLYCVYLDDHSAEARRRSFRLLGDVMKPQASALSVVFGDFNFVEHDHDRFCKTTGSFTGSRDRVDARQFQEHVLNSSGLFELQQEHSTFEGGRAMSRLDRVYVNWHACDQLDRTFECTAAQWPLTISDHRPVLFARRSTRKNHDCPGVARPLASWTVDHETWAPKVKEIHMEMLLHAVSCSAKDDLQLLKRAMRKASSQVAYEFANAPVNTHADKLACVMSFIRSAGKGHVVTRSAMQPDTSICGV